MRCANARHLVAAFINVRPGVSAVRAAVRLIYYDTHKES